MRRLLLGAALLFGLAACVPSPPPPGDPTQCDNARWAVSQAGASLPDGWRFVCPGDAGDNLAFTFVSDSDRGVVIGASTASSGGQWLRYIVAHEFCHARIFEGLEPGEWTDELAADQCSYRYGLYFFNTPPG